MPTRVKMPDGSIAEFPDGMAPNDIQGAIEQHMHSQAAPSTPPQGFLSSFADSSGLSGLAHAVAHPIDTVAGIPAAVAATYHNTVDNVQQGIKDYHAQGFSRQTQRDFGKAVPILGPQMEKIKEQQESGNNSGELGSILGLATSIAAPAAINKLPGLQAIPGIVGDAARAPFTSAADEIIPGTSITPRARFAAAQNLGVKLDAADATNSPVLNAVKHLNRDSLAGSGVYEKAKAANVAALGSSTEAAVNAMSPLDREAGGVQLQNLLKANQESLKAKADAGYAAIDDAYGSTRVEQPQIVSDEARQILRSNQTFSRQFPSLAAKRVDSVVDDAANWHYKMPQVGDALKARSGILDMYQNNPEIVKTSSDAQLQRLVGATHDAIMGSLPDEAQDTLRNAQLSYKEMKQVYDNPSSPYYHALRNPSPSSTVLGVGGQTPEAVRGLVARVGPQGQGIVQRGVAEKALGTDPGTGGYNFRTFPQAFARLPEDYKQQLFGASANTPDKLGPLTDISSTSQALSKDLNPSGTAKQGQKLAEAAALIPSGGLPLLQYPVARLMNSPTMVNWLMKQPITARATIPFPGAATIPFIPRTGTSNGTR